ncbi:glucan endo-1,3-beta-glucosidase GVI [Canna indica]|uniref:Glucan endo-1,3-beta-glucosidase GVI n=1 Tax=Canna indica TaxID=4628 RepID=A0AAQ3JSR4_9LILI|nr:glucan endo-1,3-beta-glucosidase GVI [Canna indica]
MENLDKALAADGLKIPVSTAVSMNVMGPSPVSSAGVFSKEALPFIVGFLQSKGYPLLINAYPYVLRLQSAVHITGLCVDWLEL